MWYPFKRMSLKLNEFQVDRMAYNAFCMDNIVPFGNITWSFPEPLITSDCPDIVVTFTFVNIKLEKYFRSRSIVCIVAQSARQISSPFLMF
ncbi:hypothetical protein ACFX13_009845 [Malus domestica]